MLSAVGLFALTQYNNESIQKEQSLPGNPQFKVGAQVYICNEDKADPTPLCITNYPSEVLEIRYTYKGYYEYRVKVYADGTNGIANWNPKWWVKEKYIHLWD